MSGFVGLLSLDGSAIDPRVLHRLTDALAYFAPDGAAARASGPIGLGFAALRTTRPGPDERNAPAPMPTSDGHGSWIVADAMLDDREQLVRDLGLAGVRVDPQDSDADLLLGAYRAWGTRCAQHVHGDFSFALWDTDRRRLLLARDRFGMRPLYYGRAGRTLVFSNALDVVRAHPRMSSDLDAAAIGDFLRLGLNTDLETTTFADVACVPPAHAFVVTEDATRLVSYWELPVGRPLSYRRVEEYAEHFTEVFSAAVSDRLRGLDDAVIMMSGGRDSTAVAAMARSAGRPASTHLHAVTAVYDYALPDEERVHAALAAAALDIPVEFVPQDEYRWFEDWDREDLWRPEPVEAPLLAADADLADRAAATARVGLSGDGGDAALRERESHLAQLLLSGRWVQAATESLTYVRWHRRLPRPGFRRLRARQRGLTSPRPPAPPWLRTDLIDRTGLRARWAALEAEDGRLPTGVGRPEAYAKLRSEFWPRCFEADHAGAIGIPLVMRHPFFDERVVEFLLSLPTEQWANDKGILVAAMRGRLPDRVRLRPKTPLVGDCYDLAFTAAGSPRPGRDAFCEEALEYVDPDALFTVTPDMDPSDAWDWTRAYSLSLWLSRRAVGRRPRRVRAEIAFEVS